MNLSIYIVVAYYVSKGNFAQVESEKVWGSNPLSSKKMEHCSALTGTVAGLTRVNHTIYRESSLFIAKSPIYRDKYQNIAGPIFLHG